MLVVEMTGKARGEYFRHRRRLMAALSTPRASSIWGERMGIGAGWRKNRTHFLRSGGLM